MTEVLKLQNGPDENEQDAPDSTYSIICTGTKHLQLA